MHCDFCVKNVHRVFAVFDIPPTRKGCQFIARLERGDTVALLDVLNEDYFDMLLVLTDLGVLGWIAGTPKEWNKVL